LSGFTELLRRLLLHDIPIDRELLQRILEKHFQLEAENRAYFALAMRASVGKPSDAWLRYAEAHAAEAIREKKQSEGHRKILHDNLASRDDDGVRRLLSTLFPGRQ
jgi:hypothetical protein